MNNITKKIILFNLIFSLIPLIFYLIRPDLIDYDSYFFYNNPTITNQIALANIILTIIPRDILLIKTLQFLSIVFCSITLSLTGQIINQKYGWLTGIIALSFAPVMVFEFFKFENEFIAFPFIFLGTYFFVKGTYERTWINFSVMISIILLVVAGLIWMPTAFYVIGLGLFSILHIILAIPIIIFFGKQLIENLIPNNTIMERTFAAGILPSFLLLIGIGSFYTRFRYAFLLLFCTILMILNAKLIIFSTIWLSLGLMHFLAGYSEKVLPEKQKVKRIIEIGLICSITFSLGIIFTAEPTQQQINAIQTTITLSNGNEITNDWDLGYWITYYGGYTRQDGNSYIEIDKTNKYYLTKIQKNGHDQNCEFKQDFGTLYLFHCHD